MSTKKQESKPVVAPQKSITYQQISETTRSANGEVMFTPEMVKVMHKTVAKGTNTIEFLHFLQVANASNLNPFLKEIWCYKDHKDNLIMFAGRDGFLKAAQNNKTYAGIRSCEVCENDEFEIDVANNKVVHKIKGLGDRGKITGAYAIAFRKDGEPTIEIAEMKTYDKKKFTWSSHPASMIKKVAEIAALKKAFGLSTMQNEDDFNVVQDTALPLDTSVVNENVKDAKVSNALGEVYNAMVTKIEAATTPAKLKILGKNLKTQTDSGLLSEEALASLNEKFEEKMLQLENKLNAKQNEQDKTESK